MAKRRGKNDGNINPTFDGHVWRVAFRIGGRAGRYYRRRFKYEKDARDFIREILAGDAEKPYQPLAKLAGDYISWSEKFRRKSPTTVRRDRSRLAIFTNWAATAGISKPSQLGFGQISEFQKYFYEKAPFDQSRVKKRYKQINVPANWEHYRQTISAFLNWCIKRGYLRENPARDGEFRNKLQRKIPPHFQPEELEKVFAYFDQRDADLKVPYFSIFFRLLAYTGIRLGEAQNLRPEDIDFKQNLINITKSKAKTVRTIPINQKLRPWLKRLPLKGQYAFDDGSGGHLYSDAWILRQLVEACHNLKIPRRRLHDFRHSFAASLARARVSLPEMQRLLGHELISTTIQQYVVFMNDDLKAAIASLDF
jgi:integrase